MKKIVFFTIVIILHSSGLLWAENALIKANLSEWLVPLREAIYEQKLKADEIKPIYIEALAASREKCSGTALDLALSRCEYLMGRAFQFEKRNDEAFVHYSEGMRLAESVTKTAPGDEAWVLLTESLSQSCAIRSVAYAMANGLNVDKYAKNALAINNRNAAAQYIVAARWIFAPSPFSNHKRGIEMMKEIFDNGDMDKDDLFNVYSAIGYGYIQQKKYDEAQPWLMKSLEIYPTNQYAAELLGAK